MWKNSVPVQSTDDLQADVDGGELAGHVRPDQVWAGLCSGCAGL